MSDTMYIYLVESNEDFGYDSYDGMIVLARNNKEAWQLCFDVASQNPDWSFEHCEFTILGQAHPSYKEPELILASFNAG